MQRRRFLAILRDDGDYLSDQNGVSELNEHEDTAISAGYSLPRSAGADADELAPQQ